MAIHAAWFQNLRPAAGEWRAAGDAAAEATDPGARRGEGARAGVARGDVDDAGERRAEEWQHGREEQQTEAQADALAAAPSPMAQAMELMAMTACDEHPTSVAPRVAAAAAPHKRQAVAAGTAVGVAVGVGGKPPAGDEGWTTVPSRRARRQERARLEGTSSGAARKAAAARAAATRRTAAAIFEYFGQE